MCTFIVRMEKQNFGCNLLYKWREIMGFPHNN